MPASIDPGSVEHAVAIRRQVFDRRRAILVRRTFGWAFVGLGVITMGASLLLSFYGGAFSPLVLMILGAVTSAIGLGRVDIAFAELRRYDRHVRPLPQAKLRLRLTP